MREKVKKNTHVYINNVQTYEAYKRPKVRLQINFIPRLA